MAATRVRGPGGHNFSPHVVPAPHEGGHHDPPERLRGARRRWVTGTLSIPHISEDQDPLSAALAYARAGWYVLPIDTRTKHAGSVLGKGWPAKSSRDPEQIVAWFAGTSYGLALHVGRSGAIVFDVDKPDALPVQLVSLLDDETVPYQSTRVAVPGRGHYVYAVPDGRSLGNSNGQLGKAWGEVRGRNGIIVVAPTEHETDGGRYAWQRVGTVPELPRRLAEQLPDVEDGQDAATDAEVTSFLERHRRAARPELLNGILRRLDEQLAGGESRHQAMVSAACWAMREAAAGLYGARTAAAELSRAFTAAMRRSRDGSERILSAQAAGAEFAGILAWAISQAALANPVETRTAVDERTPHGDENLHDLIVPTQALGAAPFLGPDGGAELATVHQLPVDGGDPEQLTAEEARRLAFERQVAVELLRLQTREEARRRHKAERDADKPIPAVIGLEAFLAVPDEPARYRIDGLWPVGGRVMLAAQFKAGKTTLVANLLRALADGEAFLGKHAVDQPGGRIVVIDDELDERMLRRWLREQGIAHADRVAVLPLRGRVSTFDILEEETRARWAQILREAEASIVILDCLAPVLDALGLSEDKEAGQFLTAFDEMLVLANVAEAVVVHHMGHTGERTRGASRLRDWPDVEWRLVRDKSDDGETNPAAPRYFSAYGRDVDVPESRLEFEAAGRRLSIAGGSRKQSASDRVVDDILEHLALTPGRSGRQIEDALGSEHSREDLRRALKKATADGRIRVARGARNALLHYRVQVEAGLAGSAPSAPRALTTQADGSSVNRLPADQQHFSSAPRTHALIENNETYREMSAPILPRTEIAGQKVSAPSAPGVRGAVRGECASAPPYRGGSALAHSSPHAGPNDPRDPSDLLIPNQPRWVLIDGERIDPTTGQVLDIGEAS
ncbi:bifunctional DNA primase/polymerase [Nonomuraea dietziae]|uniref:bifunctional DNA primase/polymerase n=1 Tax=Nonomuraea dietziae TaxID=65515 RepID=UPI00341307BF